MPPYAFAASPAISIPLNQDGPINAIILQPREHAIEVNLEKTQPATLERVSTGLFPADTSLESGNSKSAPLYRLDVKTHVFKKELQEYVPTRSEERLRIETIIYVELSIVNRADSMLVKNYDYIRFPKDLFCTLPDKVMSPNDMASKRILNVGVSVLCPSNIWQVEKEACVRCARRMSTKLEENESRIIHLLPELYRTEDGDALINFRNGVANIQLKINCYCSHKKEKEGFVVRFESQSDSSIASHVSTPLMFYHQNKSRIAMRAITAAAKAQAKAEKKQKQAVAKTRSIVKSVSSNTKREPRSRRSTSTHHDPVESPAHQIPSPPASLLNSPIDCAVTSDARSIMYGQDQHFMMPSPSQLDPMTSLFPELGSGTSATEPQVRQQQQAGPAVGISHMTPNTGPTRGGTLVTIHGSGFTVDEIMYVCFGESFVPVIPQHSQMVECFTPAWSKAETVAVFALHSAVPVSLPAQTMFTYVDDNEKELVKLALQRIMSISARMDGPLESIMSRANELIMWNDILGNTSSLDGASTSNSVTLAPTASFSSLEQTIFESFKLLDTHGIRSSEGLSIANSTGHTMLHLSVALQLQNLAKELITRGIDIDAKDKNGHTALDFARILKYRVMLDVLTSQSIDARERKLHYDRYRSTFATLGVDSNMSNSLEPLRDQGIDLSRNLQQTAVPTQRFKHADGDGSSSFLRTKSTLTNSRTGGHDGSEVDLAWMRFSPGGQNGTSSAESSAKGQRPDNSMLEATECRTEGQADTPNWDWMSAGRAARASQVSPPITGQNHDRLVRKLDRNIYNVNVRLAAGGEGGQTAVARRRSSSDGGLGDATEQAVVQSSRSVVESEPALFLGGQPVVRRTTRLTPSNHRQERDPAGPSTPSKTDDDITHP